MRLSVLIVSIKKYDEGKWFESESDSQVYTCRVKLTQNCGIGSQEEEKRKSHFNGIPVTNPMYGSLSEPRGQVWVGGGWVGGLAGKRPGGESGFGGRQLGGRAKARSTWSGEGNARPESGHGATPGRSL